MAKMGLQAKVSAEQPTGGHSRATAARHHRGAIFAQARAPAQHVREAAQTARQRGGTFDLGLMVAPLGSCVVLACAVTSATSQGERKGGHRFPLTTRAHRFAARDVTAPWCLRVALCRGDSRQDRVRARVPARGRDVEGRGEAGSRRAGSPKRRLAGQMYGNFDIILGPRGSHHVVLSAIPPYTRRVMCSTSCP